MVLSEFQISHTDFWFKFTLPQLNLLVKARIQRNEKMERESKSKDPEQRLSTADEMDMFLHSAGDFNFGG